MPQRIFLGYSTPFLHSLTEYLLQDQAALAETLLIVPTSQSGRTLREALATKGTALLAPTVITPGALLRIDEPTIAPRWLEKIAWIDSFESLNQGDWENYSGLFPNLPDIEDPSSDWATSLASEMVTLRSTLEEHLHNLFSASKFLKNTPESDRWENLAQLEALMEKKLFSWGYKSRSSALRFDFKLPKEFQRIVLAGVTEMPPCLSKALSDFYGELICLIAAPESEQNHFSEIGLPLPIWAERNLPASAKVSILADPVSQAQAALTVIANSSAPSNEIALGSADDQTGSALANILRNHGWPAFHPAAKQALSPITRWLHGWKKWLTKPDSRNLAALLTFPQSGQIISGKRAEKLLLLNKIRDNHPTIEPPEILHQLSGTDNPESKELHKAISNLLSHREHFLTQPFPEAIQQHLAKVRSTENETSSSLTAITDFLETASPIFPLLKRNHLFWLQILLSELPAYPAQPQSDRVIDVQGWLELLYESGNHLLICGMNDSFVPARSGGEPWLSENIRKSLGLISDKDRHARDAFLLHAMIKMREASGSSHLFCGKNSNGGDAYLPSRLLLKVKKENLIPTVKNLFREIEPPEANLVWSRDWKWQTPNVKLPEKLSVTALKDYLSCPFRFYLKHICRASQPEPDRREMNARDFGSITHAVLENWGNDAEARILADPKKLASYFENELHKTILREFGKNPPLAVRIQVHSIKQRLEWFAHRQAESHADGWEIIHIERKIAIPSSNFIVSGKIDRVDRHRETGQLRVIDYKTGKVKSTEDEHRKKITSRTRIPSHIQDGSPAFISASDSKGKNVDFLWKNLQLPIYALAESLESNGEIPIPCYINLGATKENVGITEWHGFSETDLDSAKSCMEWITHSISQRVFWPPSEKVEYDDYALLCNNAHPEEAFTKL